MRRLVAVGVFAVGGASGFAGCSLGLDDSKLNMVPDASVLPDEAGTTPAPDAEAGTVEASDDAFPIAKSDGGACTTDDECKPATACLTGRCDLFRRVCVYDVCKQTAVCKAASCNATLRTCSAPVSYGFHAGSIKVTGGGVGCGSTASRCIAASYPFVFVGTTNGVVAYSVADATNSTPPAQIPVTGLPFLPTSIIASGGRVYFHGAVAGTGPSFKLPVAWVDVPVDPLAQAINAQTVLLSYPKPSVLAVHPSSLGGVLLVSADQPNFFPSTQLMAPLQDLSSVQVFPNAGIAMLASPAAASGDRMLTFRWDGTNGANAAFFSLETGAGTAGAQNTGEQSTLATMGQVYPKNAFAQGPDGSLLWSAPSVENADGGTSNVRGVRVAWLLADTKAMQPDARTFLDIELYSPSLPWAEGPSVVGPIAWLDAQTALVLAASTQNTAQTSVQVATRSSTTVTLAPGRRHILPLAPEKLGATSANGIGYVLAEDAVDSATVHVFAPLCAM